MSPSDPTLAAQTPAAYASVGGSMPTSISYAPNYSVQSNTDSSSGFSPQTLADYQAALAASNNLSWAQLLGYYNPSNNYAAGPTLPAQEAVGSVNINGTQTPTTTEQELSGLLANGKPTLAAQEALGAIGGSPTLAAQQALGFINGQATTTEQQIQNQHNQFLANLISNAGKGFADPFTYAAKLQGLQQSGTLGNLLGNNLAFASGNSLQQLQNTGNLTNTQLATDLASAQNGGSVTPATAMFMQRMLGTPTTGGSTSNGAASGSTMPIGGNSSNPLNSANIGFSTSLQQFNRLNPTLQQDYTDMVGNLPNGQNAADFQAAMKQGAPEFAKAATARMGQVEGL